MIMLHELDVNWKSYRPSKEKKQDMGGHHLISKWYIEQFEALVELQSSAPCAI